MSARLARSWVPMLTSKGIVRSSPTNRGSRCSSPALLSNAVSVHVSGDGAMVRGSTNKLRGALLAKQTARSTDGMGATGCGAVRRLSCFLLFVVTSADTSLATRQAFALRAASCPRVGGKATPPSLDSHASCSHVSQLAAVRCCRRPGMRARRAFRSAPSPRQPAHAGLPSRVRACSSSHTTQEHGVLAMMKAPLRPGTRPVGAATLAEQKTRRPTGL